MNSFRSLSIKTQQPIQELRFRKSILTDPIKVLALNANFLYTLCLSICRFTGDGRGQGIAAITLFSFIAVAYVICSAISIWCGYFRKCKCGDDEQVLHSYDTKCESDDWRWELVLLLIQVLAGLFYYLGDNLPPLFILYGTVLDCYETCMNNANTAGIIFLAIGAVVYYPMAAKKIWKKIAEINQQESSDNNNSDNHLNGGEDDSDNHQNGGEDDNKCDSTCLVVLMLLTMITDCDLLYTVVNRVKSTDCPFPSYTHGTWAYWVIFVFVFGCPTTFCIIWKHSKHNSKDKCRAWFSGILIVLILALFLLADNKLPLSCTVGNMTETTTIVDSNAEDTLNLTRLIMWIIVEALNVVLLFVNISGCYYYCKKNCIPCIKSAPCFICCI